MAHEQKASLRAADGSELLEILVRPRVASENAALRNVEGVQPPGSNKQGVFGSGIYQAGTWERMVGVCDVDSFATIQHAMGALDEAVRLCRAVQFNGWELPIEAGVGIVERAQLARGYRALIRLIPASPHWRYLTGTKTGTGSQTGLVITGAGFAATDVGRLLVFDGGQEALITAYVSATEVRTDTVQEVASDDYTVYDAVTGIL